MSGLCNSGRHGSISLSAILHAGQDCNWNKQRIRGVQLLALVLKFCCLWRAGIVLLKNQDLGDGSTRLPLNPLRLKKVLFSFSQI